MITQCPGTTAPYNLAASTQTRLGSIQRGSGPYSFPVRLWFAGFRSVTALSRISRRVHYSIDRLC